MELTLNIGWTAVATAMCWLWVHHARPEGQRRSAQIVSMALILFTMFVIITTYDDMAMAQNLAEIRSFQHEDDLGLHVHAPFHPVVASTPTRAAELPANVSQSVVPGIQFVPTVKTPALSSIQNRPPPTA